MSLPAPYLYKTKRRPRPKLMRVNRLVNPKEDEGLTRIVHAQEASDIEERFARALYKKKIDFHFQVRVNTTTQFEDKTVDFLVLVGAGFPVEIDGAIGHKTGKQKADDSVKEALVNEWAMKSGLNPLIRVPWTELVDQEAADLTVGRLFG